MQFSDFTPLQSDQIPYSAFEGHWIGASQSYQRSLLFVMMRSTKLQKLTALKFSIVSLASYSKVR